MPDTKTTLPVPPHVYVVIDECQEPAAVTSTSAQAAEVCCLTDTVARYVHEDVAMALFHRLINDWIGTLEGETQREAQAALDAIVARHKTNPAATS